MSVRAILSWGLCLITSASAFGQYSFSRLTTADGLSHTTIFAIQQDQRGFLWLGTSDGLNRYDGQEFRVFRRRPQDNRSLSNNEVISLLEDSHQRLWVGTRSGGLNQLDSTGAHFRRFGQTGEGLDLSATTINSLVEDVNHRIWVSVSGKGLLVIEPDGRRMRHLTVEKDQLPTNFYAELYSDPTGYVWFGGFNGLLVRYDLRTGRMRRFQLPAQDGSPGHIMDLMRDRRGQFWVGTKGWGLFRYDESREQFVSMHYEPGIVDGVNMVRSLFEDPSGRMWFGTDDGILLAENGDLTRMRHLRSDPALHNTLSTHAIVCVRGDRAGNVWVGTWEGGLNVMFARPNPFEQYTHQPGRANSLLGKEVATVSADQYGNAWVGNIQGLSYIDRGHQTFAHYRTKPGSPGALSGNDVTALCPISDRLMLVSVWNKGIDVLDTQTGRVIRRVQEFSPAQVFSISPSKTQPGHYWIVTTEGKLWGLNTNTWQITLSPPVLKNVLGYTQAIETSDGLVWVGTFGDGLVGWNPQTNQKIHYTSRTKHNALSDNHINSLFEDHQRQLWVGTNGGLHRLNRRSGRLTIFTTQNGLPNDAVTAIQQDRMGNIWVTTNGGLCRVDRGTDKIRTYRQGDGLPGNDFTQRAADLSGDGTLFFGGKNGLTVFQPSQLTPMQSTFPVYLTGLRLFNQPVVPGEQNAPVAVDFTKLNHLTLRHDQSVITFDFAAVLFQPHRSVRYAYRLDGFEPAWNTVGSQRSATYTNLDPGDYQFRIRAALSDEFSHPVEQVLHLTVLPPWYRTNWAYGVYALLIILLLAAIRRIIQIRERYKTELRLEHLEAEKARELDRLRSGFFTNISHEFRTPLTLILTPLEQLLSDRDRADPRRSQFQTMHQNANRLLRLINQLLDLSKLESGTLRPEISRHDLVAFVERVAESFRPAADKQRVSLHVTSNLSGYVACFDVDILEKVLYNLLANALKFTAEDGRITVWADVLEPDGEATLRLMVEDTGVGIPPEHVTHIFDRFYQVDGQHRAKKAGSGIGLALTRELVELHRGTVAVDSQPGAGTRFTVTLPISEAAFPSGWMTNRPDELPQPEVLLADTPVAVETDNARSLPDSVPLVLVVEDHDDLRRYLVESFRDSYRVLQAANGHDALEQAEKEVPDLIVSDWLMPDMDGVQLCEALKANEKTSHVPFILLTSRSSTESKLHGLTVGADDYVTKPFTISLLRARVLNLIQSRRRLRERYSRLLLLKPTDIVVESAEEQFLKKLLRVVETHLPDPAFDVQRLEQEIGMSNTQLYRKLRALTGKGGNEFIRYIRLQRATQLLQKSGQQVAEVAFAVGFNDPNYFIRVFKKEYGCSPGEYGKKAVGV